MEQDPVALIFDGERVFDWPFCETDGCLNRVCTWGSYSRCYPCEEAVVGKEEMDKRYKMTRPDPSQIGPMARTFAEISN